MLVRHGFAIYYFDYYFYIMEEHRDGIELVIRGALLNLLLRMLLVVSASKKERKIKGRVGYPLKRCYDTL